MARYAFDIETDGLLDQLTTIHSLVIQDVVTGEMWSCTNHKGIHSIDYGLELLWRALFHCEKE